MNEDQLIHCDRLGGLAYFNCLVLTCQDLVFQHAVWMLGDPEAVEDVTQETFLLAYRDLRPFQDEDFRCWVLRIAIHLCLEELRYWEQGYPSHQKASNNNGVKTDPAFQVTGPADSSEGNASQNEVEKIAQGGLQGLSPNLRIVITLVDLQGMDYAQAAAILEIPVDSVKNRLARARVQLRERLLLSCLQG